MENKTFLGKYRVALDSAGMPVELRRNASGVACKAQDIESGRAVTLELVPASSFDAETREKIEADAVAAKQLNHINIPTLYDFGFDNGDLVYVTEYFDGTTAESWVTTHGPMPVRAVLHVALQVVSALGAAAFHLIMHRAIHPGNLLIVPGQTPEGDWPLIKVLNFGRMAPKVSASTDRNGGIDKSAPFASPEQVKDGTVDFRSEIYSLGCTLWSLLTGVSPFNEPGKPVAIAQMAPAMQRFSGVPKKVGRLIADMVSIDPDERPLDPVVMAQQLQECLASVERREALARKLGIPATWQRRRVARPANRSLALRPIAIAAILLTLAVLAAAFLTKSPNSSVIWKSFTAQKPIGVPVGVSEGAVASRPNTVEQTARPAEESMAGRETALVKNLSSTKSQAESVAAAPVTSVSPAPTASPPIVASASQNAVTPAEASPPNELMQPAANTGNNASAAERAAATTETAAASQPETQSKQANNIAGHGTTADIAKTNEPQANVAAINQNNAPAPTIESQSPSPNEQTANDSSVAATASTSPAPEATGAGSKPAESATVAANKVPRAELIEPPPAKSSPSHKPPTTASKQNVIPRAELIEPPPPAEGSDDLASDSSASETTSGFAKEKTDTVPRAELIEPPPASSSKRTQLKRSRSSASSLTKSERTAIRNAARHARHARITPEGDGAMVQLPGGMVHARFVGTTPDGQWMLALPSRRIMVVPPPPGFIPR